MNINARKTKIQLLGTFLLEKRFVDLLQAIWKSYSGTVELYKRILPRQIINIYILKFSAKGVILCLRFSYVVSTLYMSFELYSVT